MFGFETGCSCDPGIGGECDFCRTEREEREREEQQRRHQPPAPPSPSPPPTRRDTMPHALTIPTVHLNGSGRQLLLAQYKGARTKLRELVSVLSEYGPNARDYYPQGDDAIRRATAEHVSRLDRLKAIDAELAELEQGVALQRGGS